MQFLPDGHGLAPLLPSAQAFCVQIWLSDHIWRETELPDAIDRLGSFIATRTEELIESGTEGMSREDWFSLRDAIDKRDWQSWVNLFESPWFDRVWVIQEAAMTKEVFFMCGNKHLPFEHISSINHWVLKWNFDTFFGPISLQIKDLPLTLVLSQA